MSNTGRRTKINPELVSEAKQLAAILHRDQSLADRLGISIATYYGWKARGRRELERLDADPKAKPKKSEALYVEFLEGTTRARDGMLDALEQSVLKQAATDGNLALRVLARRRPELWAERGRVEVTGADGGPVKVDGLAEAKRLVDEIRGLVERDDDDGAAPAPAG